MRGVLLAIFCAALCSAQTPIETKFLGRKIPPVDQAIGHPALVSFRSRVIAATIRHDLKYLLSVADPAIGGCGWDGVDDFKWYLSERSAWDSILSALRLGGVMRSPTEFQSNYIMMMFPNDADMTDYLVVSKADAVVHEKPDAASGVIAHLHYEMVIPVIPFGEGGPWKKWKEVEYRPGKTGYLLSRDLESPAGDSVQMELRQGKWRIKWIASYCD